LQPFLILIQKANKRENKKLRLQTKCDAVAESEINASLPTIPTE
jgi:hypothetical protein